VPLKRLRLDSPSPRTNVVCMRASYFTNYGAPEVLGLQDLPVPVPADDELRVRVHATSVGFGDLVARNFGAMTPRRFNMPFLLWLFSKFYFGFSKPRVHVLGSEFSGVVDQVGKRVTSFQVGDAVFGFLGARMGAAAEYVCVPNGGCVARVPSNMSMDAAATVAYGGTIAYDLLRQVNLQPSKKLLVVGASGSIGSAAVQIGRHHYGAEVTAVCGAESLAYVRELGATSVVDYRAADFAQSGLRYDVIFDVLGRSTWTHAKPRLNEGGRYLRASFKSRELGQMLWTHMTGQSKRVICYLAPSDQKALQQVKDLIEVGKLRSVIDRIFSLEELAEAHRYAESGQKHGQIVVHVAHGSKVVAGSVL
jgi:NADPH:quinone reductase-like Zn-dependent oxidoreductase